LSALALVVIGVPQLRCQETQIVANQFEIRHELMGSTLTFWLETDLPDDTNVMVSVWRLYTEAGGVETYTVDYFDEKSKIGKWRQEQTVEIDNVKWKRELEARRQGLARAGEPFTVAAIDDHIEVGFTVPVNQENPRFGRMNENLVGSVVTQSGPMRLRIIRKNIRINFPLDESSDSTEYASPRDLRVGFTYRLSREIPLMPEFEPQDPLSAAANVKRIPLEGTITVREVRMRGGNPWYQVEAHVPGGREIGEGWVNSIALIGQDIVIVKQ
jgi:hypothetical protein